MNTVPTTSCDEAAALVLRRMEGWLDGDEGVRLDAHLETCDAGRHELAAQREVADVLAGRPDRAAPLGFATRIMTRLESEPAWLDLMNWQIWTFRLAPVAAVLPPAPPLAPAKARCKPARRASCWTGSCCSRRATSSFPTRPPARCCTA